MVAMFQMFELNKKEVKCKKVVGNSGTLFDKFIWMD